MRKIKKTLNKYENFEDTFKYSYIGLPKGFGGLKKPFFGQLYKFLKLYPKFKVSTKLPTLFYMHGSAGFKKGLLYRKWIVQDANCIFFAPNSFKINNRPTYTTPSPIKKYEVVHKLRQAEIVYNLKKLQGFDFVDFDNLFLMGNSEGALAAAAYKGKEFKGRIVTAYSCENGYYSKDFKLGCKKHDPFLNIIGTHDEYFSNNSKPNEKYEVTGNCTKALKKNKNAKVVLLPQTKHDITKNIYVKDDIVNFLKYWAFKEK
ncbi:MAG: hypothetical protein ACNI25_00465 [Halarcobacter sp.]